MQTSIIDHEEHEVLPSKIFYFFMSFMIFMVKISHFKNFRKLTGWSDVNDWYLVCDNNEYRASSCKPTGLSTHPFWNPVGKRYWVAFPLPLTDGLIQMLKGGEGRKAATMSHISFRHSFRPIVTKDDIYQSSPPLGMHIS
jgi:hypothetical protein